MTAIAPPVAADPRREPRIIQYYVRQGIFAKEALTEIKATLEAPLPSCFRINPNASSAARIRDRLLHDFPGKFDGGMHKDQVIAPPRPLSWYPIEHGAWQLDSGKNALGKAARDHEGIREFREFLLFETLNGTITRQEAVSMIPAMLLGIERHHRVLDMCAAPGSKTSQVMENLGQEGSTLDAGFTGSSGFIVANDANEKRGYLLVHQLQRLGLDTAVVTCHLGQEFPGLYVDGRLVRTNVFDRVICDVPCTGDGTIRKNKNIWGQWFPGGALSLHKTQLELGLRAAALLQPGGLMVYSTCSFNPIENEAIVAEMLRRADGALEVVDTTAMLPGLVRRPGITEWEVAWLSKQPNAEMDWFKTYEEVPTSLRGIRIPRSMFPTDDENIRASLRHCMRLFPTDQNTGGFFVTLLRKKHQLPGDKETGLPSFEIANPRRARPDQEDFKCRLCGEQSHTLRNCPESWNGKRLAREREEKQKRAEELAMIPPEPLHGYATLDQAYWDVIESFYGLRKDFPRDHLCSRSDGATSVCLVNRNVQEACLAGTDLKVLNTGVRVFARVTGGSEIVFRPAEEGLGILLPYLTKRKFAATRGDMDLLLQSKIGGAVPMSSFSVQFQQAAGVMETNGGGVGPAIALLSSETSSSETPFALPVWLGSKSIGLLVDKSAQTQLLETLTRRG